MDNSPKTKENKSFPNSLFSANPTTLIIIIFLIGLLLRFLVASNLTPVEDEMVHGVHALGFSKLAPLSTMTQGPVWSYLTDYAYRIFGVSLLTARFLSFIFGSLSIILIYLISNLLYNRKVGLVAAFLLAVSAFHITWTASYQDQSMMFFVLLASYFFIKEYQTTKKISLLSALFLGIAELIKIITGVFVLVFIAFMMFMLYNNYKHDKKLFKQNIKHFIYFIIILILALTPIIAYNIFLYKEKGIVDLPIAQFLRINPEFYMGPGLAHGEGFVLNKLGKNLYSILTVYFIKEDLLIFLLGALGIIYFTKSGFKNNKKFETLFFITTFFFVLIFLASSIVLQTHYTTFFPLFALFAAPFIMLLVSKMKNLREKRYLLLAILTIIVIYNIGNLHDPLTSESATQKLRSYISSVDENTLVLVDSRIYTGTYTWALYDKHYLNANYISELLVKDNRTSPVSVKTIFIECVNDDCGWGTIKDQPELNESMEQIIKLMFNPVALQAVDQTHAHFFYRIPRNADPKGAFDYYVVDGAVDKLLNIVAYIILYILIFVAVLSIIIPFYLLYDKKS